MTTGPGRALAVGFEGTRIPDDLVALAGGRRRGRQLLLLLHPLLLLGRREARVRLPQKSLDCGPRPSIESEPFCLTPLKGVNDG